MDGLIRQGRDLRVDFCRGVALYLIFVDHIPGNVLGAYTLRNFALSDATEAFVLLAGYAAGLAYGAGLDRQGWAFAAADVLRRCFTLYVAHIFLFVVFTAQVGYSAAALDSMTYLDELQLDAFGEQPYRALLEALLLRFQPAFLDILPLYIVLLGALALALPLLRRPALLLGLSLAGYAAVRATGATPTTWTGSGWYFNPLAWQALFFAGCVLGYVPPGGAPRRVPLRWWLVLGCVALLALGLAAQIIYWSRPELLERMPERAATLLSTIDKSGLHPLRLLSILAIAYLVGHAVPAGARWLRGAGAAPFVLMGQQGLPVFCCGIFLSFLGRVALEQDDRWAAQAAVNALGLVALVAVGAIAAWYRPKARRAGAGGAGAAARTEDATISLHPGARADTG